MAILLRFFSGFSTLLLLLLLLLASSSALVRGSVHDELPKYGLPAGLLPTSVTYYTLSANGDFEVQLEKPCYVQFSDLAYYEKTIRGKLSYGVISDLSGIQVRKFFVWVSVIGIVAHPQDGTVEFSSGLISESLPATMFDTVHTCKATAFADSFLISEV